MDLKASSPRDQPPVETERNICVDLSVAHDTKASEDQTLLAEPLNHQAVTLHGHSGQKVRIEGHLFVYVVLRLSIFDF